MSSPVSVSPQAQQRRSAFRGLVAVSVVALLSGVVLAGPAYAVAGQTGLQSVLISVGLCLLPGLAVVLFVGLAVITNPFHVLLASTGLRMTTVLTVALVVKFQMPDMGLAEFYIWLACVYLATLAAETRFVSSLLRNPDASGEVGES